MDSMALSEVNIYRIAVEPNDANGVKIMPTDKNYFFAL